MSAIIKPVVTTKLLSANPVVENAPQRILFIGQQLTDSSVNKVLVKNIGSDGQENALFGERSMLATMIRNFRAINTISRVDAIPLNDDITNGKASASITFGAGTITKSSSIKIYIQSKKTFVFQLNASVGDNASDLTSRLSNLINDNSKVLVNSTLSLPDTVDIDASFFGEEGNFITIEIAGKLTGVDVTLTGMNSGTGSPSLTGILDQVSAIRYQTLVVPASYDKATIADFLDARFNSGPLLLQGVAIASQTDTEANLISAAQPLNSSSYVLLGNKPQSVSNVYEGSSLFEFGPSISAKFAAIRTLRLTEGADISNYIVSNNSTVVPVGGPSLAARPYHNTPFSSIALIEEEYGWTQSEQNNLNNAGVSFLGNNRAYNTIIAGDIVTTYLTDSAGNPDNTFKFLNYVDTGITCREFFDNNNYNKYSQTTLTTGRIIPGAEMVSVGTIKAYQDALYRYLSSRDPNGVLYALVPAGSDADKAFQANLSVVISNASTGVVTISGRLPINGQLREIDGALYIDFSLTTTGA